MRIYAGVEPKYGEYNNASVLLQSIPYDGTSTWGKGADKGFDAFLDASENMELNDIETKSEVYKKGVHILPAITEKSSAEAMFNAVYKSTQELINSGKFLTFFGGEHSVSPCRPVPAVRFLHPLRVHPRAGCRGPWSPRNREGPSRQT